MVYYPQKCINTIMIVRLSSDSIVIKSNLIVQLVSILCNTRLFLTNYRKVF